MRQRFTLGLFIMCLLTLVVSSGVVAQDTAAAETAATTWLAHVDAERYADSWTSAATAFKQAVTRETWQDAAKRSESCGASRQAFGADCFPERTPDATRRARWSFL